jgi:hypothetical protein
MRKTDLTPEVQERICSALRAGNTRRASAIYGGVSETTFYRWMQEGEAAKRGAKREFREAVIRAEAECEVWHVANLKRQADGDWRASVEWLKRRRRDEWSERIDSVTDNTTRIIVEYMDGTDGENDQD